MADFYQTGVIATLHRLGKPALEQIEAELAEYGKHRPIALVLPSIYAELEGEALKRIVQELQGVNYLRQVIVTMGRTNAEEFQKAKKFFSTLPQETTIIWNTGERFEKLYSLLRENAGRGEESGHRPSRLRYSDVLT
jgi:glucosyl-3-phosphoglycerate synthase